MPNRIIKESICTSDSIDNLTLEEEVFFYRLMVNCDDYGRIDARPDILRAKCFPLKIDKVKTKEIESWLYALRKEKLILLYVFDKRNYLQLITWDKHQQVRAKRSKCPSPDSEGVQIIGDDSNCNQMISDDDICPRNPIQSLSLSLSESNPIPYGEIMECFNEVCSSLPKIREITKPRETAIKGKWNVFHNNLDECIDFFKRIEQSDWLSGRNEKGWKASFDWIFKPANFTKIIEGNYDNKELGNKPLSKSEQQDLELERLAQEYDRRNSEKLNTNMQSEFPAICE